MKKATVIEATLVTGEREEGHRLAPSRSRPRAIERAGPRVNRIGASQTVIKDQQTATRRAEPWCTGPLCRWLRFCAGGAETPDRAAAAGATHQHVADQRRMLVWSVTDVSSDHGLVVRDRERLVDDGQPVSQVVGTDNQGRCELEPVEM